MEKGHVLNKLGEKEFFYGLLNKIYKLGYLSFLKMRHHTHKIMEYKVLLVIVLISIVFSGPQVIAAIDELSIETDIISRPWIEGQVLQYNWKIKNVGMETNSYTKLIFEVQNAKTQDSLINLTYGIPELPVNGTINFTTTRTQIPEGGILNLFIYPEEPTLIKINGLNTYYRQWIIDSFRVYTITEITFFLSVLVAFFILWNQFLKGGELVISHPRYYSLLYDNRRHKLKLKLPLIFQNEGAKSVSVSYLMIILKKGRERIVLKWERFSNRSIASQFIVPARGHVEKTIWFVSDYYKRFQKGKWHIKILSHQDGLEMKLELLNFNSTLTITRNNKDFDFWEEEYKAEKKISLSMRIAYWIAYRLPKGYFRLGIKVSRGFLRLIGKR